ncbi:MAG: class I SAM-dependent methyltransferase [Fibrobacter sp.]|nr:class I SAM-dependent methyltransferase [Fibrobacter sp.]
MTVPFLSITRVLNDSVLKCNIPEPKGNLMQDCWDLHGQDERFFPFWLEEWPSAFGLYDFISQKGLKWELALEIGCGAGVLGQLLHKHPGKVVHTDIVLEACVFARQQIKASNPVLAMDFTRCCLRKNFDLVLGTDLFYEDRLVHGVCEFLQDNLTAKGKAFIADPVRKHRMESTQKILQENKLLHIKPIEWNYKLDGKNRNMIIWQFQKAKKH